MSLHMKVHARRLTVSSRRFFMVRLLRPTMPLTTWPGRSNLRRATSNGRVSYLKPSSFSHFGSQ